MSNRMDCRRKAQCNSWLLVCAVASAGVFLTGCSGMSKGVDRVTRDVMVVAIAPLQIPVGAVADTVQTISDDGMWSVLSFPFIFVTHAIKHTYATAAHVIDLPLAPIHVVAGNRPVRVYRMGRGFPLPLRSRNLRRGAERATFSAREIPRRLVSLAGDVGEAGLEAAQKTGTWYTGVPQVSWASAVTIVTKTTYIILYVLDYAVSPIYMPFGPRKFDL